MTAASKKLASFFLFFLGPLLIAEPIIRLAHQNLFQRFEAQLRQGPIDMILVGSSRVAAAIDGSVLGSNLSRYFNKTIQVANLGRGYSTPHDKYVLLRHLLPRYHEKLKGSWLLIEAPGGVPEWRTWDASWAVGQEPGLLAPYVGASDLCQMILRSSTPSSLVAELGLYRVSRAALALRKLRDALSVWSQSWRPSWSVTTRLEHSDREPPRNVPLEERGGILAAPQIIQAARSVVEDEAAGARQADRGEDAHVLPPFDETVWSAVIKLAQSYGLRVAFFEPPMGTVDLERTLRLFSKADKRDWDTVLRERRFPFIRAVLSFPDSSFPDHLHLVPEKVSEFTHSLSEQFIKAIPDAF